MINLLPLTYKNSLQRHYIVRILAVSLLLVSLILFIGVVLLVPSVFVLRSQANLLTSQIAIGEKKNSTEDTRVTREIITDISSKLAVFPKATDAPFSISEDGISGIQNKQTADIRIAHFLFTIQKGKTHIGISGVAHTRTALVSFVKTLESDTKYTGVSLPISNLVKDTEVPFTLEFDAL